MQLNSIFPRVSGRIVSVKLVWIRGNPGCKGLRVAGSKERASPDAREVEIRRRKCEDFAPRNEGTSDSGERGAKRGGCRVPEKLKSGGGNVKILLPETKA